MRKALAALIVLTLVLAALPLTTASAITVTPATAVCDGDNVVVTINSTSSEPYRLVSANPDGSFDISAEKIPVTADTTYTLPGPQTFYLRFEYYNGSSWLVAPGTPVSPSIITCPPPPVPLYTDGRVNGDEVGSPIGIYNNNGALDIYTIHDGDGRYAFTVDAGFVADLPAFTGETAKISTFSYNGVNFRVYWLDTGELQINVGPNAEGVEHVYIIDAAALSLISSYRFTG